MIDLRIPGVVWPWQEKLRRGIWQFLIEPMVCHLPKSLSIIRITALRLMGAKIGKNCLINPHVRVLKPWLLEMSNYVAIGRNVEIYNFAKISIGEMTVVSQNCYLCTGTHDYTKVNLPLVSGAINIGSQVWIAANVMVLPGVSISDGVIIGAGAVVTKSTLLPWWIYAGNPSRSVKSRPRP